MLPDEPDRLLERAEASLAALRLTSPPGDNAVEQFNEVLRLDPGNAAAKSGLHQVVEKYVDLTNAAINNRQFDRARRHLERAEAIEPASQELMSRPSPLRRPYRWQTTRRWSR